MYTAYCLFLHIKLNFHIFYPPFRRNNAQTREGKNTEPCGFDPEDFGLFRYGIPDFNHYAWQDNCRGCLRNHKNCAKSNNVHLSLECDNFYKICSFFRKHLILAIPKLFQFIQKIVTWALMYSWMQEYIYCILNQMHLL